MRRLTIAVLFCVVPVFCLAQQATHKLSDFAGTWQANFNGTPFMILNLAVKDGHLTGSASFGDINADPNGVITAVEAPTADSPIVSSRLLSTGLLELTSRGDDPDDTIVVVLKLIDAKTGSVRFGPAMGHEAMVVKPIPVHRIEPKS